MFVLILLDESTQTVRISSKLNRMWRFVCSLLINNVSFIQTLHCSEVSIDTRTRYEFKVIASIRHRLRPQEKRLEDNYTHQQTTRNLQVTNRNIPPKQIQIPGGISNSWQNKVNLLYYFVLNLSTSFLRLLRQQFTVG